MPKFLDAPSWYNPDGLETKANGITFVSIQTLEDGVYNLYDKPNGIYIFECTSGVSGIETKISVTSGIYLRITAVAGMQPLIVRKIECVATHVWKYYVEGYFTPSGSDRPFSTSSGPIELESNNGAATECVIMVLSSGTAVVHNQIGYVLNGQYGIPYDTNFYAPTSAGDGTYQVLCGGMPTPTFRSLYLHCFSYKITGSSVIGWLTLSIIYPSSSPLTSAQITNKLSRFNDANNVYPASGGYIVPSIGTFERVTMITGIYWAGTYFATCGVRSNMYAENIFTFSPGSLTETGSYSISHDTM